MSLIDKTIRRSMEGAKPNNKRVTPFMQQPESRFSHASIIKNLQSASDVALWDTGTIKWFDQTRRYGFITADENTIEIFLPWTILQESNIPEKLARIGTPVRFRCDPPEAPGKRPRATHVILIKR